MSLSEFNKLGYTVVIAVVTIVTTNISILPLDDVITNWQIIIMFIKVRCHDMWVHLSAAWLVLGLRMEESAKMLNRQ